MNGFWNIMLTTDHVIPSIMMKILEFSEIKKYSVIFFILSISDIIFKFLKAHLLILFQFFKKPFIYF